MRSILLTFFSLLIFFSPLSAYLLGHNYPDDSGNTGFKNQAQEALNTTSSYYQFIYTGSVANHSADNSTGFCANDWYRGKVYAPPGAKLDLKLVSSPNTTYNIDYKYGAGTLNHTTAHLLTAYSQIENDSLRIEATNGTLIGFDSGFESYFPDGTWIYFTVVGDTAHRTGESGSNRDFTLNITYKLTITDRTKFTNWLNTSSNFDASGTPYETLSQMQEINNNCSAGIQTNNFTLTPGDPNSVKACYTDGDQDGYGSGSSFQSICTASNESINNSDCDDTNPNINPNKTEVVGNIIDENCDSKILCYKDSDNDTFSINQTVLSNNLSCSDSGEKLTLSSPIDCNDNLSSINPGATEIPNDGIDQDCSGSDLQKCYPDSDKDGYGDPNGTLLDLLNSGCYKADGRSLNADDTDDSDNQTYPGATEIVGDGKKQNSSATYGEICYKDSDNDGFLSAGTVGTINSTDSDCNDDYEASKSKFDNSNYRNDCDDNNANININATEIAGNDIDENCNAKILCYVDNDNDGVSINNTQELATLTCSTDSYTLLMGLNGKEDNCPDDPNPDQLDSDGNGIGDVCDRDFTSLHRSGEGEGSLSSFYISDPDQNTATFSSEKNITFASNELLKLERMYIPPMASEVIVKFESLGNEYDFVTITSKFRAVENYTDLKNPLQYASYGNVQLRSVDRQNEDISIDNFDAMLSLNRSVESSGKSVRYSFNKDMINKYAPNGGWIYFVVNYTSGKVLKVNYFIRTDITSAFDRYKMNQWHDNLDTSSAKDDTPNMLVYKKDGTVANYIFENDYNSTANYISIHDIRAKNGYRGLIAHAQSAKLTHYIKHTYHALIDKKTGEGTNKFKAYIPSGATDFSLFMTTKPKDGDIKVKIQDGASTIYDKVMHNRMSYKLQNTSSSRWIQIDMSHESNDALGVMFEYKLKYNTRPSVLDGIKGDPQ